ncbi:hypothetical protein V5O48_006629 [Marasmius crinis-equi]|uniref:Uncharacterized protein n=1 Tax=Marasmius crinis-equi TaxID=585013 RepID=A0ABR3FJ78_9AGAR
MITIKSVSLALLLNALVSAQSAPPTFDWNTITPDKNLSWSDCYEQPVQCARLEVPLNYSQPDDGKTTAIAIIKYPAAANESTGGPIFFNPGGPGGSGVDLVLQGAPRLQQIVGTQFDIVSFDPRGIGLSTPNITIFNSPEEKAQFFSDEASDMNSTATALDEEWERFQTFGKLAVERDTDGFLSHVSTDNVARDLLHMAEAMGQEKVQFWGLSYGTVIGTIFATMFPDRVGRFVVDGCLDMDGYLGNDLKSQMVDADTAMQMFYDDCFAAGPESCPFHAGSSSSEIASRLQALYESLRANPVEVQTELGNATITYDVLRQTVFTALSQPALFQPLSLGLTELEKGNGTIVAQILYVFADPALLFSVGLTRQCSATSLESENPEGFVGVECSDAVPLDWDATELRKYMAGINSTFAGMVAVPVMARCAGWQVHPESRFKGPVGANTDAPLLFIGNTADPLTPLSAAQKNQAAFPGSGLLTQDSPGHTSLAASSSCTVQAVAAYFANGTLPEEGTVCSLDKGLFAPASENSTGAVNARRSVSELVRRYAF